MTRDALIARMAAEIRRNTGCSVAEALRRAERMAAMLQSARR
jgi:hypothetical protein